MRTQRTSSNIAPDASAPSPASQHSDDPSIEKVTDTSPTVSGPAEIINWQHMIERLGDEELIQQLLPTYLKDNQGHCHRLSEALAAGDHQGVKSAAHAIGGAGRNLGATRLSEVAEQMESAGLRGDLEAAKRLWPRFRAEVDSVMAFLSRPDWMAIAKRQSETPPDSSP